MKINLYFIAHKTYKREKLFLTMVMDLNINYKKITIELTFINEGSIGSVTFRIRVSKISNNKFAQVHLYHPKKFT